MRGLGIILVMLTFAGPVAAGLLPQGIPGVSEASWGVWKAETADGSYANPGRQAGLALDSLGNPHITYGGGGGAWYARRAGVLWEKFRVESDTFSGGIAVDSLDRPHVVVAGGVYKTTLRYGVWDGNGFTMETVEVTGAGYIQQARIAFDDSDRPHISYELAGSVIKYATKVNGNWVAETIDTHQIYTHDMAVDPAGRVHVVYSSDDPGDAMRYAVRDLAGAWTITVLQGCTDEPGIDLDSAGRPHISCHSAVDGLEYYRHDGTQWVRERLDDGEFWRPFWQRGFQTDIALDSQDRPHVAYSDRFDPLDPHTVLFQGHMKYATKIHGAWVFEQADPVGTANGFDPSIQVDMQDRPRLSYILGWVFGFAGCSTANPCFDLKYAEPAVAALGAVGQ